MSTSISYTDCGCGGAGSGNCDCNKGVGLTAICTDQNFKRPRFFAGQLLTEDDLQSLTDYVVGKNRLHNRFLFGDGVVCGLSVTCHPCGDGQIVVAPGFALDCCGNDLLVPCKEDVDIKALLRDLRKRQLAGYDCGDPCDDKDTGPRTYGLYLTYTEHLEDPVAPYASTDPCGQQACEPTRVCEGYRFELRCDCDPSASIDVFKRIQDCVGDLRKAAMALSKAQTAELQASHMDRAVTFLKADTAIPFTGKSVTALRENEPMMADLKEYSIDDVDEAGNPKTLPNEYALRLNIARYQILTGAVTRFNVLPEKERTAVLEDNPDLDDLIETTQATLAETGPKITALAPRVLTSPISRTEAVDSVRLAQKYVLDTPQDGAFETTEARMVALNTPVSFRQINRMNTDASLLKDWLIERLENSLSQTRCDLYDRLRRIRFDQVPGQDSNGDLGEIAANSRAVKQLVGILIEYLLDCICLALNPPCQPCDDPSVLLACVTVDECEVIEICNMSRKYVLSPTAMRYWLPPISWIGDLVKRLCCDFDLTRLFGGKPNVTSEPDAQAPVELEAATAEAMPIASGYSPFIHDKVLGSDTVAVLDKLNLAPADMESVTTFSANLALLSTRAVGLNTAAIGDRVNAVSGLLDDRFLPQPGVGEIDVKGLDKRMSDLVTHEIDIARKDFKAENTRIVADSVKTSVSNALSEAKLRRAIEGTAAVKALKAENSKLSRELKKMSAAIVKLQAGGAS